MNIEECIKTRRSTRKYSEQEITKEVMDEIIELTRFSPSWKNTQVVRFHIVTNDKIKENIGENCVLDYTFNTKTMVRCKSLVIISVVKNICGYEKDGSFTTSQGDKWEMFDAGIAAQTFALAAHSKGIGSVVLGIFDEEKIRDYITIPENEAVAAIIATGYTLEAPKTIPPRKEVDELVSYHN